MDHRPEPARSASPTCSQSFCEHCDAPILLDDLHQALLKGTLIPVVVDLCPACYEKGVADGSVESTRPN